VLGEFSQVQRELSPASTDKKLPHTEPKNSLGTARKFPRPARVWTTRVAQDFERAIPVGREATWHRSHPRETVCADSQKPDKIKPAPVGGRDACSIETVRLGGEFHPKKTVN